MERRNGKKAQEIGEERERGGMVEADEKLNGFEKEGKVGRNERIGIFYRFLVLLIPLLYGLVPCY